MKSLRFWWLITSHLDFTNAICEGFTHGVCELLQIRVLVALQYLKHTQSIRTLTDKHKRHNPLPRRQPLDGYVNIKNHIPFYRANYKGRVPELALLSLFQHFQGTTQMIQNRDDMSRH